VEVLDALLRDCAEPGDAADLLGDPALRLADEALAHVDWTPRTEPGVAVDALRTAALVALLHQRRGQQDPGRKTDELRSAGEVMLTAMALAPEGSDPHLSDKYRTLYGNVPEEHVLALARHAVGMRVLAHAERTSDPDPVRRALVLLHGALTVASDDHPHLAALHSNRGSAHSALFECTGDLRDLDAAVEDFARAAGAPPGGVHPAPAPHGGKDHAAFLGNLGASLAMRFDISGDTADLDAAVDVQRQALRAVGRDDQDRALQLSNLGTSLTTRFEHTGDTRSLAEALRLLSTSVRTTPPEEPDRAARRGNLARALVRHFEQTADTDALRAALDQMTEAVAETPEDHPDRPLRLGNLAGVCLRTFDRTRDTSALNMADDALQEALRRPHRLRRAHLANAGTVRQRRFDVGGDPRCARAAVAAYEEGLALTPIGHPDRPGALSNLANALLGRHRAGASAADLDRAVGLLREAVRVPSEEPDRCRYLTNLGAVHEERAKFRATDPRSMARERERALAAYATAAGTRTAPTLGRARAAQHRGRLAAATDPRRTDALDGYRDAIGLLETLAWFGLGRTDQERLLREFSGAAGDAAACAVAQGRNELAVELLEQGRGVLLAQAVGGRTGHDLLHRNHPALARRLHRLQGILDRRTFDWREPREPSAFAVARSMARSSAVAAEREALLAEIRRLPGLERFLLPPDGTDLRAAAEQGPVVVVNVSRLRCDALVVTLGEVRCVPLPELTWDRLRRAAGAQLRLVAQLRRPGTPPQRTAAVDTLREMLAWLWATVARPVLADLGLERRDHAWPRLWWCPTGLLALLPLHAAQYYDAALLRDTGVADHAISSYTPTLRSLIASREPLPGLATTAREVPPLLTVCVPRVPGRPPLRHAEREVRVVREAHPSAASRVLVGGGATVSRVKSELHAHRRLLFVGHSAQNPQDPGRTALFAQDGPLTMREIAALRLRTAELAFLSSCESALGDVNLPDEAISLAGALQIAGFRHVVASLWSVVDAGAPEITGAFFARQTPSPPGGEDPATALHAVLRTARSHTSPLIWAGYCHTGC
jgi:hypothetical protein